MSTNITEEELLLRKRARRRLVGSIILVLASIVILPAIFDEPKPGNEKQEIAINLSPTNNSSTLPQSLKTESVGDASINGEDPSIEFQNKMKTAFDADEAELESSAFNSQKHIPIPGIKPKVDRNVVAIKETTQITQATPNTSTNPNAVHAGVAAVPQVTPAVNIDSAKAFVIQLGAYSDQAKAKQQHNILIANGFKAYIEIHNDVMRVRIGPFATRAAADNEIKKLKKFELDGVILPR